MDPTSSSALQFSQITTYTNTSDSDEVLDVVPLAYILPGEPDIIIPKEKYETEKIIRPSLEEVERHETTCIRHVCKGKGKKKESTEEAIKEMGVSETEQITVAHVSPTDVNVEVVSGSSFIPKFANTDSEVDNDGGKGKKVKFPIFQMPEKMTDYKWEVGTYFLDKKQFKDAIITYAVHSSRNLKIKRNEKTRMMVKCKGGQGECKWHAWCEKLSSEDIWQLKEVAGDEHTCSKESRIDLLSTKWLSGKIQTTLRENPNLKIREICEKTKNTWSTGITMAKAFRAMKFAKDDLPPSINKMPERPKKRRNLEPRELKKDDTMLRRVVIPKKCSRCHKSGHNKTTCPVPHEPTQTTGLSQTIESSQSTTPTQTTIHVQLNTPMQPTVSSQPLSFSQTSVNASTQTLKPSQPSTSTAIAATLNIEPAASEKGKGTVSSEKISTMRQKLPIRRAPQWKP